MHTENRAFRWLLDSSSAAALAAVGGLILLTLGSGLARADWILPPDDLTKVDVEVGDDYGRILATDASGGTHAVWVESFSGGGFPSGTRVFYKSRPPGGQWDAEPFEVDFISTNFWITNPSIYASGNGDLHVVWQKIDGGDWDVYYRRFENGVGWDPVVQVHGDAVSNIHPKLVADAAGAVYAIWFDQSPTAVQSKRRDPVGGWDANPTRLDSTGSTTVFGDISVDQNDKVYAFWSESVGGVLEVVARSRPSGGGWDANLTYVSPVDASWSGNPTAATDNSGTVHVLWMDTRAGVNEIFHRQWHSGSGLEAGDRIVVGGNPPFSNNPQVAADSVGGVHLIWRVSPMDIGYRRYAGAWDFSSGDSLVTVDQPGTVQTGRAFSVSATPWGTPQVAWQQPGGLKKILFEEMPAGLRKMTAQGVQPDLESGIRRFGSTDTSGTYTFDTPDPVTIRTAKLIYSYANFDWLVDPSDPYPEVGRNNAIFQVYVDDLLSHGVVTVDTSFRKMEVDITALMTSTDSTRVRYDRISGDDDFLVFLPTLMIWDTLGTVVSIPSVPLGSKQIFLRAPVPNPFNGATVLRFELPRAASRVSLNLYDVRGRRVATLLDGVPRVAGLHAVPWDGRDSNGTSVATGVYFYELIVDGRREGTRRAVRLQ
jgi:hypothetical protein